LAGKIGISRTEITNLLRLLQLPQEIKEEVKKGTLTYGHARTLLSLESIDSQKEIAEKIINERLSVRETEELVSKKREIREIPEIRALESKLQNYLETRVKIQPQSPERGRITIEYKSLEELERIIGKFLE
ncbi:MAG TPA: chromosome partitioning protein ParB, partial [bacterium]|nr:chromosome partitioning protein ParB [bacterium]